MESPIIIEHRDALTYLLFEAAELEHAICCQYLFAAFSLKQDTAEGVTDRQLRAIDSWRRTLLEGSMPGLSGRTVAPLSSWTNV